MPPPPLLGKDQKLQLPKNAEIFGDIQHTLIHTQFQEPIAPVEK